MKQTYLSVALALLLGLTIGLLLTSLPETQKHAIADPPMPNSDAQITRMETGETMGNQEVLYLYTRNQNGDPVLMSYYVEGVQDLRLLAVRSLKYDQQMGDKVFPRGQKTKHRFSSPSVQWVAEQVNEAREKEKEKEKGSNK